MKKMKRLKSIVCLFISCMLCACVVQKPLIVLNREESNSIDYIYDVRCSQNRKINIVVYEYLNNDWKQICSQLCNNLAKITISLHEPTSQESDYYLQINSINSSNITKNILSISFEEESESFHQKNISKLEITENRENLVLYEWDNSSSVYELSDFQLNDEFNAKRAYLITVELR